MKALVLLLWISTLITEAASPVMEAVRTITAPPRAARSANSGKA